MCFFPLSNDWREWPWLVPLLIYVTKWMMCNKEAWTVAVRREPRLLTSSSVALFGSRMWLASIPIWVKDRGGAIDWECRQKDTIFRNITKEILSPLCLLLHCISSSLWLSVSYYITVQYLPRMLLPSKTSWTYFIMFKLGNGVLHIVCCDKI